jgi:hypothetical protein
MAAENGSPRNRNEIGAAILPSIAAKDDSGLKNKHLAVSQGARPFGTRSMLSSM